jgi:hypothetical protein
LTRLRQVAGRAVLGSPRSENWLSPLARPRPNDSRPRCTSIVAVAASACFSVTSYSAAVAACCIEDVFCSRIRQRWTVRPRAFAPCMRGAGFSSGWSPLRFCSARLSLTVCSLFNRRAMVARVRHKATDRPNHTATTTSTILLPDRYRSSFFFTGQTLKGPLHQNKRLVTAKSLE